MPERSKQPAVPFQTLTRATAAQRARSSSTSSSTIERVAVTPSSPSRPSRILARWSPSPMATNEDLIQALTAFTQAAANDRVIQQQKHDDLLQALQTQQNENVVLRNLVSAGPLVNRASSAVVDSIPKFEGRVDEDVQGFIDHIDRIAVSEGWTDVQRVQVAIRRLLKTALLCHVQTGHTHGDWDTWSTALVTNFSRQLSFADWNRLIQDRAQQPNESGMEYALDKFRLCRLSPTPLTERDAIPFLINGLARWEHVAAMIAAAPTDIPAFIARIQQQEQLGVSTRADVAPNRQVAELATKLESLTVSRSGGRGRGGPLGAARPPMECWICHKTGHKARCCPTWPENTSADR
ncbi:hypothetical protein GHT06_020455 [Daphnia sinensis]|uniref:CCHC-type domain-containing protein n=1 Tax=Daphnia sinensis TaxID=1820382 RepID=A0AAD5KZL5_9CRUS|nr:hypothetical protein GHT06_020455 [Daphnia sinensis]